MPKSTQSVSSLSLALAAVVGSVWPAAAADSPSSAKPTGHLVTEVGRTEPRKGRVVLDVRKSEAGDLTVRVTLKLPDDPPATNRESEHSVTSKLPQGDAAWFVYTDDGEQFWLYDGQDAGLLRIFVEVGPAQGNVTGTTIHKSYKAADAAMLKGAPQAVRDRLPQGRLEDKPEWSKPVNGLSARLVVTFEDCKPGLRHLVTLELKNVSTEPISVSDRPHIKAELFTVPGSPDPKPNIIGMSGGIPNPQWGTIPHGATLSFRVDSWTVGTPTKDMALLALGGVWHIKPGGTYILRTKLIAKKGDGPKDQWVGEMILPPVKVAVTKEQVTRP